MVFLTREFFLTKINKQKEKRRRKLAQLLLCSPPGRPSPANSSVVFLLSPLSCSLEEAERTPMPPRRRGRSRPPHRPYPCHGDAQTSPPTFPPSTLTFPTSLAGICLRPRARRSTVVRRRGQRAS